MVGRFKVVVQVFEAGVQQVAVADVEHAFRLSQYLALDALLDALAGEIGDAVSVLEVVGHFLQLVVVEVAVAVVGEVCRQVVPSAQPVFASGGEAVVAVIEVVGQVAPRSVRAYHPAFVAGARCRQREAVIDVPVQALGQRIVGGAVDGLHCGAGFQLLLVPLQVGVAPSVRVVEVHAGHALYLSDGQSQ